MSGTEDSHEEGRYRRLGLIDAGGMGEVYLAHDVVLDRRVALKVLAADIAANREFALRLAREARTMAALDTHPNIVQIFDVIMDRNELCLVLEFVDGMDFKKFMVTPAFTEELACKLLNEVALALVYLHDQKSMVHRDIKPANILIRSRDREVKLTDFGIARLASAERLTQHGVVIGTEKYMAPEVRAGDDATPASDIWSLGTVMREALDHLRVRNPQRSFDVLDSAILEMTEQEPSKRPSARDLARRDFTPPALHLDSLLTAEAPTVPQAEPADSPEEQVIQGISWTEEDESEASDAAPDPTEEAAEHLPEPQTPYPASEQADRAVPDPSPEGEGVPESRALTTGQAWTVAAALVVVVAFLMWAISPISPLHQAQPSPLAAPSGTVSASTSLAPTTQAASLSPSPASTEPLSPPMAGPWTAEELNSKLIQTMYKIAVGVTPNRSPMALTAARTDSMPLDPRVQFAMDNQVETADGKQVFWHLRVTANRGTVDFTPHMTTCTEMANAAADKILPGIYMVVPLTDASSTFAGTLARVGDKAYGIIRADCVRDEAGASTTRATLRAGATGPAQDFNLLFRLPVRPDKSWDKAATPSLGMFMMSTEGHIVLLEA